MKEVKLTNNEQLQMVCRLGFDSFEEAKEFCQRNKKVKGEVFTIGVYNILEGK